MQVTSCSAASVRCSSSVRVPRVAPMTSAAPGDFLVMVSGHFVAGAAPSKVRMRSPGFMPARSAGPPSPTATTRKLQDLFFEAVKGKTGKEKPSHPEWLTFV